MNTCMVHLTLAQYLRIRRKCGISTPGPKAGFCIQYDIPGHAAPFKLYNYSYLPITGKGVEPYSILYSASDAVTAMLVRNVRRNP